MLSRTSNFFLSVNWQGKATAGKISSMHAWTQMPDSNDQLRGVGGITREQYFAWKIMSAEDGRGEGLMVVGSESGAIQLSC